MKSIRLFSLLIFYPLFLFSQTQTEWVNIDYQSKEINLGLKINNLSDYSFFLHGETHTVESIPHTRMSFLKYYYKEANVRNFVIEAGYASAYLLNLYLKTGDESYICKDYNFFSHKEYQQFWRELYEFNKSLSDPIQVVGVDDLESTLAWYRAIEVLFENKLHHCNLKTDSLLFQIVSISGEIDDIVTKNHISKKRMDSLKETFILNYKKQSETYEEILQEDSVHLRFIIQNNKSTERNKFTDKNIYENLLCLIEAKQINEGHFFGQFGSSHVANYKGSLTYYLHCHEKSYFNHKILTVLPEYINCKYAEFNIEENVVYNKISPIKSRGRKKVSSLSNVSYILEELKNKRKKPNKYTLHIKNKDAMLYHFPEVCD